MTYQTTTQKSWGQNLAAAFIGMIAGIILFIGGTVLLYWNEGNYIKTRAVINQASAVLVSVNNVDTVDSALNGQLIHATAKADTQENIHDNEFDITINAIALKRDVQYYQWVEHSSQEKRNKLGGGTETVTTYTYDKRWENYPVNSNDFANPDYRGRNDDLIMDVSDQTLYADTVKFGAYRLPRFLVEEIDNNTPIKIPSTVQSELMTISGNQIYVGENVSEPNVGDIRVEFTAAFPSEISLIAQVNQDTFVPFVSPSNHYEFSRLAMGERSADTMIADAHDDNDFLLWTLRIAGIIGCIIGLIFLLKPLSAMARVLPLLGGVIEFLSKGIAIITGLSWSLVIIAIGWLRFRPLIGLSLLAIVAILVAVSLYRKKQKIKASTPPPPPISN